MITTSLPDLIKRYGQEPFLTCSCLSKLKNLPIKITGFLIGFYILLFSISCNDDKKSPGSLQITFDEGNNYVYKDTALQLNQSITLKIQAESENSPITLFQTKIYKENMTETIDSGLNSSSFTTLIPITKGITETETWVFKIRNKDLQWDSISINLTLKGELTFKDIDYHQNILLGAQEQTTIGNFYSTTEKIVFTFAEATNNQDIVDICYFYDPTGDLATLASPNANIVNIYDLGNWTIKNKVLYAPANISLEEFDACQNDSLLIATTFTEATGKRKSKQLFNNQVIAFLYQGKKGLIKVIAVEGETAGSISFDIKMDK